MWRFILITFAGLGWAFYELSGGSDFEPRVQAELVEPDKVEVLTRVEDPVEEAAPIVHIEPTATVSADETAPEVVPEVVNVIQPREVEAVLASLPAQVSERRITETEASSNLTSALAEVQEITPLTDKQVAEELAEQVDIRKVSPSRVNMRGGPGTSFSVLAKLTRDTEVEVLRDNGDGWVKLRVVDTGRVGWMAERLLVVAN